MLTTFKERIKIIFYGFINSIGIGLPVSTQKNISDSSFLKKWMVFFYYVGVITLTCSTIFYLCCIYTKEKYFNALLPNVLLVLNSA